MKFRHLRQKSYAFSLMELIMIVVVIFILMALVSGALGALRNRSNVIVTENNFSVISRALIIYKESFGSFPYRDVDTDNRPLSLSSSSADQHWLITTLSTENNMHDFSGRFIKKIKPIIDLNNLEDDGIVGQNAGEYFFRDAWDEPILYFYGVIEDPTTGHPYFEKAYEDPDVASLYYNVNWAGSTYDLVSYGEDRTSLAADPRTRKNDISNFK